MLYFFLLIEIMSIGYYYYCLLLLPTANISTPFLLLLLLPTIIHIIIPATTPIITPISTFTTTIFIAILTAIFITCKIGKAQSNPRTQLPKSRPSTKSQVAPFAKGYGVAGLDPKHPP